MASDLRKELLDCSVCLNIYTDPVTLRCGHNFCRECIDRVLDTQEGSGVYSCPECRAESTERPTLVRNITLCNIVESFLQTPPAQEQNGIFCTYCVDSPVPAVKMCLLCEASLCDKHLRVHSKAPEHVLMEPTTSMENKKCSVHKKILEYFCIKDSTCICVSCRLDGDHQGHQVETLDKASDKKKKELQNVLQELITKREEMERKEQSLQEQRQGLPGVAAKVKERVSSLIGDLTRQLEELEKKVVSEISRQEEQLSWSLSDLIHHLESSKEKLSRRISQVEEMCNMTDPLTILQGSHMGDLSDAKLGDNEDRKTHNKQNHIGDELDVTGISHTIHTICDIIGKVKRGIYVQEPADILLDKNTAGNGLHISDDMKTASWSKTHKYPEAPERFNISQVLSSTRFTSGRHSWEVEIKASDDWIVGMCYASINKKGDSQIGKNCKSWGLDRYNSIGTKYTAVHNKKTTPLNNIVSNRFRIFLDYEGGKLSFYELCQPIRHLHTFTATFTEPLHVAVYIGEGSVKISRSDVEQGSFCKE